MAASAPALWNELDLVVRIVSNESVITAADGPHGANCPVNGAAQ